MESKESRSADRKLQRAEIYRQQRRDSRLATPQKLWGVYTVTSKTTNRVYVGCSDDIRTRWMTHLAHLGEALHNNEDLTYHWMTFGQDDLVFEFVQKVRHNREELLNAEAGWMLKYHDRLMNGPAELQGAMKRHHVIKLVHFPDTAQR